METIKFTLESGLEIHLTNKDLIELKPFVEEAFAKQDSTIYNKLKALPSKEIEQTLKNMSNDELISFAKVNDLFKRKGYNLDYFTKKIFSEIFNRNNLGFKQIGHLSTKQANFLLTLDINPR